MVNCGEPHTHFLDVNYGEPSHTLSGWLIVKSCHTHSLDG